MGLVDSYNTEMECMDWGHVAEIRLFSFFALFVIVGVLARSAIHRSMLSEGQCKQPLEEVVAAFEVYGCNIGHIYVFQIYGLSTHLVVILIVGSYHAFYLKGFTANPINHVLQYLMNCCPPDVTMTKIFALVLGGLVSHVTVTVFWPVLMAEFDRETLVGMHCAAASTSVPAIVSLGVEFFGMALTCITIINITSSGVGAFESPMKLLITCLLSGAGQCTSHIYLNPVVANNRLIGCKGQNLFLHLVIYWIAPIAGAAVAVSYAKFTSCNGDLFCLPFSEYQTSCLQRSKACAGLESDLGFLHSCNFVSLPNCECRTPCLQSGRKSDVNPDGPCLQNIFRQAPCSSRLVSNIQMPPIYVSRTGEEEDEEKEGETQREEEQVEDENSDDEVIYSCGRNSGRVNAVNYDKQADMSMCHRRYTEQPFDDTCCRGFPGSNTAWPSGAVSSRKTYGIRNHAPISSVRRIPRINRSSLCDDLSAPSDCMNVACSCCGYSESLSSPPCHGATAQRPFCSGVHSNGTDNIDSVFCPSNDTNTMTDAQLLPASENYPKPASCLAPAQSCTIRGVPDCVSSGPETPAPPIRQRSITFKQPLRDNSQGPDPDELVRTSSHHKIEVVDAPQLNGGPTQEEYMLQPPETSSSRSCEVAPSPVEYMTQPPNRPPACKPRTSEVRTTCSRRVSSRCSPDSPSRPSHKCPTDTHQRSSQRHSPECPTDTHRKSSHKHRHRSSHKRKHSKCPTDAHPTQHRSHSRRRRSTSRCRIHKSLHPGPSNACPTPAHNDRHRLSPSHTKHRTPSCQRPKHTSSRRASPTRSKPFPTSPQSCMF